MSEQELAAENAQLRAELLDTLKRLEGYRQLLEGDALSYLRTVYNNQSLEHRERMKAAELALQYEKPRLSATVMVMNGKNFAGLAEQIQEARKQVWPRLVKSEPNDAA